MRIRKKNFQDDKFSHEYFLTTRQKIKVRNVFANNMSMDIKLSKTKLPKIIQAGGFLGALFGNFAGPLKLPFLCLKMFWYH